MNLPNVDLIRGKGLLNAIVMHDESEKKELAWSICLKLAENGLLAKPTHGHIIRLAPPLVINDQEVKKNVENLF